MSFRIALTGLGAASADLGVISNNIANSATGGFKASRAEFAELVASGIAPTRNDLSGSGVQVSAVTQQHTQGNLAFTGNALDLGINGEGFFRVSDNGTTLYTRAGNFKTDREGYVVNNAGHHLTGYQTDANGNLTGVLGDIQLPTGELTPRITSEVEVGMNLDAADSVPSVTPFDRTNPMTFNHSTSLSIYDSLGAAHTMTTYYTKNAAANTWDIAVSVDDTDPAHVTLGSASLSFQTDGSVDTTASPQPITVSIDMAAVATELGATNGAATPLALTLDFSQSTQFGSPFSTHSLVQDGFSTGRLAGIDIDESGVVFGRYTNGQSQAIAQVALANFRNPQGLTNLGDTVWAETFASGSPLVGAPGTASLGSLQSGAFEESNVELTDELVAMISAQRNFQANAQVISTADTLTQTIINLR